MLFAAADEANPLHALLIIDPVSVGAVLWRDKPQILIMANGSDGHTGLCCGLPDFQSINLNYSAEESERPGLPDALSVLPWPITLTWLDQVSRLACLKEIVPTCTLSQNGESDQDEMKAPVNR